LLGVALRGRSDVTIATKVGCNFYGSVPFLDFSPSYLRFACERSLRRLKRDYLDLYLLHNPSTRELTDGAVGQTLRALKVDGKIRAYGVSVFTVEEADAAIRHLGCEVLEVAHNLISQRESGRILDLAAQCNAGVVAREPLCNGLLTGKYHDADSFGPTDVRRHWPREAVLSCVRASSALHFLTDGGVRTLAQAAIRFVLDDQRIATVIPGAKTSFHVRENLAAATIPPLTRSENDRVRRALFGDGAAEGFSLGGE
jgi:aryl-alcohol dehydrogenase-like predicted oxidoreductase